MLGHMLGHKNFADQSFLGRWQSRLLPRSETYGYRHPPAENHVRRNARKRHPRSACLLRRLPPLVVTTGRMIFGYPISKTGSCAELVASVARRAARFQLEPEAGHLCLISRLFVGARV
jgi:hypothetical protein